jgi:hypothetical protein
MSWVRYVKITWDPLHIYKKTLHWKKGVTWTTMIQGHIEKGSHLDHARKTEAEERFFCSFPFWPSVVTLSRLWKKILDISISWQNQVLLDEDPLQSLLVTDIWDWAHVLVMIARCSRLHRILISLTTKKIIYYNTWDPLLVSAGNSSRDQLWWTYHRYQ